MVKEFNRKIVLESGEEFYGYAFGAIAEKVVELVFNTSMLGYQEILSDPSYTDQAVVMTYPLIGNYGIVDEDFETKTPTVGGLVVREYNDIPSNFRYTKTLSEIMEENGIPGIQGLDTRKLTRILRDHGSCRALFTAADTDEETARRILSETVIPEDAVARVTCKKRWYSRTPNPKYNVVVVDCGLKLSLVRSLNRRHCNVTVVPFDMKVSEIMGMQPDGILISNGPGNPAAVTPVVELIRAVKGKIPVYGAGLGCALIALAYGGSTYKLKYGHHGGNHPVKTLETELVEIVSQDHTYAVAAEGLEQTGLAVTQVNLTDGTVEGIACEKDRVCGVLYHPENAAGPAGSVNYFDRFISAMEGN